MDTPDVLTMLAAAVESLLHASLLGAEPIGSEDPLVDLRRCIGTLSSLLATCLADPTAAQTASFKNALSSTASDIRMLDSELLMPKAIGGVSCAELLQQANLLCDQLHFGTLGSTTASEFARLALLAALPPNVIASTYTSPDT